ncbi:hypothetical protein BH23GEM5_BH23GEM5_11100 [soil metagenome]
MRVLLFFLSMWSLGACIGPTRNSAPETTAAGSPDGVEHLSAHPSGGVSLSARGYELRAPSAVALRATQIQLDSAVGRFRQYIGEPPRISVVVFDLNGTPSAADSAWIRSRNLPGLWLPTTLGNSEGQGTEADRVHGGQLLQQFTAHEACHTFFFAHVEEMLSGSQRAGGIAASGSAHYGHPAVPDWFDEAVAVLCERPDQQERRRRYMAQHLNERIPLADFFSMPHPVAEGRAATGGSTTAEDRTRSMMQAPSGRLFYAQALSVVKFLAEQEGPAFVGQMARQLARGLPMSEVLKEARRVPREMAALDAAWRAWVAH